MLYLFDLLHGSSSKTFVDRRRRSGAEIIDLCVRRFTYRLSYRDLAAMMAPPQRVFHAEKSSIRCE